ncbi:MAG: hypothetical protein AVDCRST_MAG20-506, partial [uncultured Acidimicrobiales bacterium]
VGARPLRLLRVEPGGSQAPVLPRGWDTSGRGPAEPGLSGPVTPPPVGARVAPGADLVHPVRRAVGRGRGLPRPGRPRHLARAGVRPQRRAAGGCHRPGGQASASRHARRRCGGGCRPPRPRRRLVRHLRPRGRPRRPAAHHVHRAVAPGGHRARRPERVIPATHRRRPRGGARLGPAGVGPAPRQLPGGLPALERRLAARSTRL